jgi:hypothetical protein
MSLPTSDVVTTNVGGQIITRVKGQSTVFPPTWVGARTCMTAYNNWR